MTNNDLAARHEGVSAFHPSAVRDVDLDRAGAHTNNDGGCDADT